MHDKPDRRKFLTLVGGCGAMVACGQTSEDIFEIEQPQRPRPGVMEEIPQCPTGGGGNMVTGPLASEIKLYQATRAQGDSVWVCRNEKGLFAVDNRCTHAGCATVLSANTGHWECPCHGSRFTYDGVRVDGPALLNFPRYAVCQRPDGTTLIDKSKKI